MGKITGFLEFSRINPHKRYPEERKNDYDEFINRFKKSDLVKQAARCMNCGVPFCHSDYGCPLGNHIPLFNDAVYRENWEEAYQILTSTNNFPEFTGRICPAPCETACVLGINEQPVTIEEIEKHIIEIAYEKGLVKPKKPLIRTGKKVAVIGSGPAGLAAAAQLNYAGHTVTVFERDDAPGGLLRYGIPDFKLEKWVIDRRVAVMEEEGVEFLFHKNVGVNVSASDLLREYHAIVLAGGSTIPRGLEIPGNQSEGIHFAVRFLKQQNKRNAQRDPFADAEIESNIYSEDILATGKNVVVIGGGDTGSDCVGTSNRQGAASVTQFELMPMPPKDRNEFMPWPTYPMKLKTTSSHELGCDREWAILTKEFVTDENGNLKGLKIVDLDWNFTKEKRPAQFLEKEGTERIIPCELALLAMGFIHPQHEGLLNNLEIKLDQRGNVEASAKEFNTNIPKVFAAGDMRRGQSLVVWAISEGRECARKVDEYLMGSSLLPTKSASLISRIV
ncbi:MAG: glutamate synthase subunit beta [Chitinophagaceae bacterium]|nr:glutamate synthase subunit beta [Chitinophagaceae bacterium]